MRIALFTDSYLPKFDGVTFVVDTWAELLSQNHEVKVFAPAYSRKRLTENRKGFTVERFESLPVPSSDRLHVVIPDFQGEISETIENFKPNIIHLHSPGVLGLIASRMSQKKKIPLVGTFHTLLSEMIINIPPFDVLANVLEPGNGEEGIIRKAAWGFSKMIYSKCDLIVCPAEAIKKDLRIHGFKNWSEVISNGTDMEKFKLNERNKFTKTLLHVGRISFEKHVDVVVQAFEKASKINPDLRLVIVGDGSALNQLKKLVLQLGIEQRVKLVGFVPREKLVKYYNRADYFVTASTMEVQPMVLLEALSTGLPVIAVNKAGLVGGDIKNGLNGYLVARQDEYLLAEKILKACEDEDKWKQMQIAARKTAEDNSVEKSVKKMEKLYKKLIT